MADFLLDIGEAHFGLLDASAAERSRVKTHLAGIHAGEEVLAHHPREPERPER